MSYNTKNYEKQGGAETVIGGTLTVQAGAVVTKPLNLRIPIMSGLNAAGTPIAASAAAATDFVASAVANNSFNLDGTASNNNNKVNNVIYDVRLPDDYKAGENVTCYIASGFSTSGGTVSAATIDLVAGLATDGGAGGADICATAAQTIAADTAEYAFTITGTTLTPGCRLLLKVSTSITNNNATNVTGHVFAVRLA